MISLKYNSFDQNSLTRSLTFGSKLQFNTVTGLTIRIDKANNTFIYSRIDIRYLVVDQAFNLSNILKVISVQTLLSYPNVSNISTKSYNLVNSSLFTSSVTNHTIKVISFLKKIDINLKKACRNGNLFEISVTNSRINNTITFRFQHNSFLDTNCPT
jgi:hypothetical protein